LLGWTAVWFLSGLKADCVLSWRAVWLLAGLKVDWVPGWITVWMSLGPEGCNVEPSLGGGGLEVGEAGLGSGGRGTSSLCGYG